MTPEDKRIQKTLNKIMSEEMLAHMFYMGCIVATCHCQSSEFAKMFTEIAEDELNDHFMHLKEWALFNDYEVPFKMKDYIKFAEADVKRLDSLKNDQDAIYYVNEAIESEKNAIESYNEAMQDDAIPYDLNALLVQNYYDECDHLEQLSVLKYALEAGAALINY